MSKELLLNIKQAINNTNRFLLSSKDAKFLKQIENRVQIGLWFPNYNNHILREDDILQNKFKLSTNTKGEYILESTNSNDSLLPLNSLIDNKSGINYKYLDDTIHPKTIIGLIIEKGEIYVLLAHNTTEDKNVDKIIGNIELNKPLDNIYLKYLKKINDPQYENYKTFEDDLDDLVDRGVTIYRSEGTWGQGKLGNNPFINAGKLPNGKTQFISGTLIKCKLSNLEKNFDIYLKNLPPVHNRISSQTSILSKDKIEILDMSTGTTDIYGEIMSKDIYPIDYSILGEKLRTLNDLENLEQILCQYTGQSWLSFKILKGLVLQINPVTSEIIDPIQKKDDHLASITESSEFNSLPEIPVPSICPGPSGL